MFLSKLKVGLLLLLVLPLLGAAPPKVARAPALKKYRVRAQDIEAGFVPAKMVIVAGEPIHTTFTVKNLSAKPFRFWFGGDYRATGRHGRFKVSVTDVKGVQLIDPLAERLRFGDMGGTGGCQGPKPGRTHGIAVNLEQYRTFPGPGEYTITCKFDIEAPEGGRLGGKIVQAPVQTTWKLTVLPHTAENVRPVVRELARQAKAARGTERYKVTIRLASFGRERAVPELAALAKTEDREQRVAALFALGNLPMASGSSPAKPSYQEEEDARAAAAEAARAVPLETEVGALLARLPREASASMRRSLLVALGNTRSPRRLAPLEQALRDPSPEMRRAAVRGLVLCGGARAVQVLERLAGEDLPMREAVVIGLVEAHRRPLRPEWLLPVMRAVRDGPARAPSSTWAMDMLRTHLGKKAVPRLIACVDFQGPSPRTRYNSDLMRQLAAIPGAPKVRWHYAPSGAPALAQVKANQRTLADLRAWLARHEPERLVPEKISRLIRQLGSAEFGEREKASRDLEAVGARAFEGLLMASLLSADLETRRRADGVMEALLRRWSGPGPAGR